MSSYQDSTKSQKNEQTPPSRKLEWRMTLAQAVHWRNKCREKYHGMRGKVPLICSDEVAKLLVMVTRLERLAVAEGLLPDQMTVIEET